MYLEDVVEALQADGGHVEVDATEAAQHRDAHDVRSTLSEPKVLGRSAASRYAPRLISSMTTTFHAGLRASHVRTHSQNSQNPGSAARPLCQ